MNNEEKTKEQLLNELAELRRCIVLLEASEEEVKRREEALALLKNVILAINETEDLNAALFAVLEKICSVTDWVYGEIWVPDPDGKMMERNPVWYSSVKGLGEFSSLSEGFKFQMGKGLPGRVWASKQPLWVEDVTVDEGFCRKDYAREAGLKAGLGIPILAKGEVTAILAFYMLKARGEDKRFVGIVSTVAAQVGTIIRRKKAEEDLRQSEEHFRSVYENSQDCICHISLDGKYLDMNRAGLAINEFDGLQEAIGKIATASIIENRKEAEEAIWKAAGGETVSLRYQSVSKNGKKIWWDSKVTPIRGMDGTVRSVLRISRDITELKKGEEELIKSQRIESLGTLAGGIAHDFRNILTIVIGKIALAKMHLNPEDEVAELLTSAEKACKRATDLTNQLLTFSKGGVPIKKTVSIADLIKESVDFSLRGSKVKCKSSIPKDLWPVEVDEGQISQVINNLIINADQAMPEGGKIIVSAENISDAAKEKEGLPVKEGRFVKISIKDQGVGIPKEHLSKIFDPYFTTKQKGSGLGLTTSYSIIKKHEGYITAESEIGVGTTFHIYLPASQKEIPETKTVNKMHTTGKGKVLFMDDEEMLRESTCDLLIHLGYEALGAGDGSEAVLLYQKSKETGRPFDAVILDLTVPGGMGGKEALEKLIEIDPDVKAIVSSGYSNDAAMSDFRKYGFKDVVVKPYKIEELSEVLNRVISG